MKDKIEKFMIRLLFIAFVVIMAVFICALVSILINPITGDEVSKVLGDILMAALLYACGLSAVALSVLLLLNVKNIWNSTK